MKYKEGYNGLSKEEVYILNVLQNFNNKLGRFCDFLLVVMIFFLIISIPICLILLFLILLLY